MYRSYKKRLYMGAYKMIKLREYQQKSIDELIKHKRCLLISPTGSGKGTTIVFLTKKMDCKTLVIVPTTQLVKQMIDRFKSTLNIEASKFNNKNKKTTNITISTWQSMANSLKDGFIPDFDMIIADESHKISDITLYGQIVKAINPKYFYALTATAIRHDGIGALKELCNHNEYKVDIEPLYKQGFLIRPNISFIETGIKINVENSLNSFEKKMFNNNMKLGRLKSIIGTNKKRNELLLSYIKKLKGNHNLVLSYTIEQTKWLYDNYPNDLLEKKYLVHGQLNKKNKDEFFEAMESPNDCIVFATQSLLGVGIDIVQLDTLFLTTPFGGGASPIQFAGRVLRPYKNKIKCKNI
jgi:superfamily II DNA or RNA helicase